MGPVMEIKASMNTPPSDQISMGQSLIQQGPYPHRLQPRATATGQRNSHFLSSAANAMRILSVEGMSRVRRKIGGGRAMVFLVHVSPPMPVGNR